MHHAAVFSESVGDELRREVHGGCQRAVRLRRGAVAENLVEAVGGELADARIEAAAGVVAAGGRRVCHSLLNHVHAVMPVAPAGRNERDGDVATAGNDVEFWLAAAGGKLLAGELVVGADFLCVGDTRSP